MALLLFMTPAGAEDNLSFYQEQQPTSLNQLILQEIRTMPSGGGYSAGTLATHALQHAVTLHDNILRIDASHATPSYCSGATYLVFLKTIAALQATHQFALPPAILAALKPTAQPDGTGIWGRWNANGPGTARLFAELGLGSNFSDPHQASPGDFLKIWWNDQIGAMEHGHSVIYLGQEIRDGIPVLSFWSSNVSGGFGVKSVPLSRIHRLLFSRLQYPEHLARASSLPETDHYLESLQRRASSPSEMNSLCGVR